MTPFCSIGVVPGMYNHVWWRLTGVSFFNLTDAEKDLVLEEWGSMISVIKEGVLLARRITEEYRYGAYSIDTARYEYYALAPPGVNLSFFNASRKEPKRPRAVRLKNPRTLLLEDGRVARVYVVYRYPLKLPEGFTYMLLSSSDEAVLVFKRIPRSRAIHIADSVRKRRLGVLGAREEASVELAGELASRIIRGADLYEFHLLLTVIARDYKALEDKAGELRDLLKTHGLEAEAPYIQLDLYYFKTGGLLAGLEKKYTDTYSLKPFFFLVDEEVRDEQGVFLGVSGSGCPVILDLWSKPNLNFVVLGVSGAGKSMTVKIYLKRLRELDRGIVYFGVDPESEYTRASRVFDATSMEITEGEELGLDPVRLLKEGFLELGQVADVLSELYAIPPRLQGVLRRELFVKSDRVIDLESFIEVLGDKELKGFLKGALAPPDIHVYRGRLPELRGSTIFGLKNIRSRRLKALISSLISVYAYNKLLSKTGRSVFFIDEAWLFLETPSLMGLLENIARRGRKHGVVFIYVTQRAEDLARTPQGRSILEQSATVLVLRQEQEGRNILREIYGLSDAEVNTIVNAPPGYGLLKTGGKRLFIQVLATSEELGLFSTSR